MSCWELPCTVAKLRSRCAIKSGARCNRFLRWSQTWCWCRSSVDWEVFLVGRSTIKFSCWGVVHYFRCLVSLRNGLRGESLSIARCTVKGISGQLGCLGRLQTYSGLNASKVYKVSLYSGFCVNAILWRLICPFDGKALSWWNHGKTHKVSSLGGLVVKGASFFLLCIMWTNGYCWKGELALKLLLVLCG